METTLAEKSVAFSPPVIQNLKSLASTVFMLNIKYTVHYIYAPI